MASEHIVRGALIAARTYLREQQQANQGYGYFLGGDPRDFTPDGEVCTPEEIAAHRAACEAWERGERPELDRHHHKIVQLEDGRHGVASFSGPFGMGVYTMSDEDADDVLGQIEAALAALDGGPHG